jgi:glutamate/tyrosine decarboxylase-like PLP-dependent enzyme/catechol 2,3-dioxygenase-like lactoylglutathione lyase family enzyme
MIRGIHHVAVATGDIDRLIDWYQRAFGFELCSRSSWRPGNSVIDGIVGIPDSGALTATMRAPNFFVELFQFTAPEGRAGTPDRPVSDHGYTHFCLDVVDIEAEYERLVGLGMRFHGPPAPRSSISQGLVRSVYGRDPDGNVIELQEIVDRTYPLQLDLGTTELHELLRRVAARAADHRDHASEMPVYPNGVDLDALRTTLGSLGDAPTAAADVVDELADAVETALVATTGPRYFGFVVGGSLDAATAADVLTTGWDQPAFNVITSPAAAVVEDVAGGWLKELLGLPAGASFGFVTGGQGANTVSLAAARHHVLAGAGWDVEQHGLLGAPRVRVVATGERHATIDRTLRLLGLGAGALEPVATDDQGAIDVAELARALASAAPGPTIVCLQAGNVNTGAFDDLAAATAVAHDHGAWVHVDGAFGLWATASPVTRHLTAGVEAADSWATDGHKWLNVPYDSGYAFCAHPAVHAAALSYTAAYLTGHGEDVLRAPSDFVLESSRRARGFTTWAALRQLGRSGVAELVERCCAHARRFAEQLSTIDGAAVANDVVLNQVLVSFGTDDDTERVIERVQRSGVCWMGGTTWHGRRLMRISVSNWRTTEADIDRSVAAIRAACTER